MTGNVRRNLTVDTAIPCTFMGTDIHKASTTVSKKFDVVEPGLSFAHLR